MTENICLFSGGLGSFAATVRLLDAGERVTCLFTDTRVEDPDLYRFLDDCERVLAPLGATFHRIADGRDIWQVFRDERFLGNPRMDPCSKILKRKTGDAWLSWAADPPTTTIIVGIDWTEEHRFTGMKGRWAEKGWTVRAPLCEAPTYGGRREAQALLDRFGIAIPRLYTLGFAHNNCGGGCVKAGIGHWAHVLRVAPDIFTAWEAREEEMRAFLGKDVSMLVDRRGGVRKPLPLSVLRRRIEGGEEVDRFEIGGCGCFVDEAT